jgi:predicted aspartyl protease
LSKTSFFRVRGSDDGDDPCGVLKSSTSTIFTPIFVKILCNNTPQEALIDTGSAITIIHEQLLNKIPHKQFIQKPKNHLSASCSMVNIIGEILLEIKINGIITQVIADVAIDLVTNLILGNDWILPNNVYIMTPEKRIMIKKQGREVSAPFINPPLLNYPVTLVNHITLLPFTEHMVEAKLRLGNMMNVLFEPNTKLQNKALFTACMLLNIKHNKANISIINATNKQQTLSKGTKIGTVTHISNTIGLIIPENHLTERILKGTACEKPVPKGKEAKSNNGVTPMQNQITPPQMKQYQCRECHLYFAARNDLFKHLRNKCYPDEIRKQINKLTTHIGDVKQQEQIKNILWRYGKLFDTTKPSKIDIILENAIDTGTHRPIHTAPYRKSNKDQEILSTEAQKLLKQEISC